MWVPCLQGKETFGAKPPDQNAVANCCCVLANRNEELRGLAIEIPDLTKLLSTCYGCVLKGESHYDEEKEIIQKQLKIERDELLVICQQHQVSLSVGFLITL